MSFLPVKILLTKTVMFPQFLNGRLIAHGTPINCSMVPKSTFFEDVTGQLYHLVKNGTFVVGSSHTVCSLGN